MNPPKCQDDDYLNFLLATPRQVSATEAARVQPAQEPAPAHDAFTRLLQRLEPQPETLGREAQTQGHLDSARLGLDDSTLDKPYAKQRAWGTRHWSGPPHAVGRGINWLTRLWTAGDRPVPCDYRVGDKAQDGWTKPAHFQALRQVAQRRGFQPAWVGSDSWEAGLENLKGLRALPWLWRTRLKAKRKVKPDRQGLRPLSEVELGAHGRGVGREG